MASQGPKNGEGTLQVRLGSSLGWGLTAANTGLSDNVYAQTTWTGSNIARDSQVLLYFNLQIGASANHATTTTYPGIDTYEDHGGATELWELEGEITPGIINGSDFAALLSVGQFNLFLEPPEVNYSDYLKVSNFQFTIPIYKTEIDGIVVGVERQARYVARTNVTTVSVDHIRMTVYYTQKRSFPMWLSALVPLAQAIGMDWIFFRRESQTRTPLLMYNVKT